ncbi:MAG: serine hydrolase, partial [Chloroflexi bacterium]|nr:serine hydrolase [Chloroflexota bacterium]
MEYERLGERRRGVQVPVMQILSAILLLGAIVLGMIELVKFSNTKDDLATDLTVGEIAVGGLSEEEAQARWEAIYLEQPVRLYYEDTLILLDPVNDAGFGVDSEAMLDQARAESSQEQNFWAGFWNYLWRRPVSAVRVPLKPDYDAQDRDQLREFLEVKLAGYDSDGQTPDPAAPEEPARRTYLDIDQALVLIESALRDPEPANREVILPGVVEIDEPPPPQIEAQDTGLEPLEADIRSLIDARGFTSQAGGPIVSVYVLDLETGDELGILENVAHSSVSVVKIPIMINLFRQVLLVSSEPETAYLLTESILCSNNSSSNFLIQRGGLAEGYPVENNQALRVGLRQVSCTAQEIGAERTYISAPLWVTDETLRFEAEVCRPQVAPDTTFDTRPDPYSQTTAADMGFLLTMIYDCAYNNSGLLAVYPDGDITQTECEQMIELLSGNRIDRLIELGVPLDTPVAHKNGWG